jgi:hypothetical protein
VGIIDIGERIARNARRLPVVGSILERDYERSFHHGRGRYRGVYASFAEAERSIPPTVTRGIGCEPSGILACE